MAIVDRAAPAASKEGRLSTRTSPPFRADHVGSLLRPKRLLDCLSCFQQINQKLIVDVEYAVSYRSGAGSQLQVSVLASGVTQTKYDSYDPIDAILGAKNNIDDELECALVEGLERVVSCDQ